MFLSLYKTESMRSKLFIIFLLIIWKCMIKVLSQETEAVAKLPQGLVRGTFQANSYGSFSAFRGIPYASPPTGSLRLKDPEPLQTWPNPLNAAEFRSICPQKESGGKIIGNEDCLYLNVYTPVILKEDTQISASYPVMVFIHGGNFRKGSSTPYGAEKFTEKKVVLVTFNYRIGILGFLSTGDESCPGNFGLKDQVMVLKWVRDNIQYFGGNSNLVTLFGQDAGGASVFLHILSPQSKGLFHRAITQSGSPFCNWTLEENPYDYAREVSQYLHCPTKSTSAMIECIRGKNIDDILYAQDKNKTIGDYPLRVTPVIEKNGFLSKHPEEIISSREFQAVPLIAGVNKDDGSIFYSMVNSYREQLSKNSSFLQAQLLPMFILNATDIRGNIESVSEAIMFNYFNGIDSTNVTQVLQPFINMSTDALFLSCNYKALRLYTAADALAYMYSFEYKGKLSMLDLEQNTQTGYNGVSHGDELMYLFNMFDMTKASGLPSTDKLVGDRLLYLWTEFAKTGKSLTEVGSEYQKWEPYTNQIKNYYEMRDNLLPKVSLKQREVDLWLHHLPRLSKIKPSSDDSNEQYRIGSFGWAMFAIVIILSIVIISLLVFLYKKSKGQYFETSTELK